MEKLQKKLKKQGGFTLVEMLIVVAIIAILIAVSIPMVTGALDKAKQATDAANARAAKAEASVEYLSDNSSWSSNPVMAYDAISGSLKPPADDIVEYGQADGNTNNIVYVTILKDVVYYCWDEPADTAPTAPSDSDTPGADGSIQAGTSGPTWYAKVTV